jgi:hypothetical protein
MTERADKFVELWISEHLKAEGYQVDGDFAKAQDLAEQCLAGARAADISESEVTDEFPGLVSHMASEIEDANDRVLKGLVNSREQA